MFRKLLRIAPAAGIILLASTGDAAVKITPALQKNSADSFTCRLVNAGTKQVQVTMQILGVNGAVLSQGGGAPFPGATASVFYTGPGTVGYCKVEGSFSKKRIILTLCPVRAGDNICEAAVGDPPL